MRCKECKEKIPDNKKYCPECGAILQRKNYDIRQSSGSYTRKPIPAFNSEPNENKYKTIYRTLTSTKIPVVLAMVFLVILFCVLSVLFKNPDSGSNSIDYENFGSEYEIVAEDYVYNLIDSISMQDYGTFNLHTAIDWDMLYFDAADANRSNKDENAQDDPSGTYESEISSADRLFDTQCDELFSTYIDIYFSTRSSQLLGSDDLSFYFNTIDNTLNDAGLSLYDYIDTSSEIEAYEVWIDVYAEDAESMTDYKSTFSVIVFNNDGYYEVLYDHNFIDHFLNSMIGTNEPESITDEHMSMFY